MWPFRKPARAEFETLTGVTASLTASHRSREHGDVHEHTWRITAWIKPYRQTNALHRRDELLEWIARHEGTCLPDEIAWAEDMARDVMEAMTPDWGGYSGWLGTVECVEISRENEGLLARRQRPPADRPTGPSGGKR